MATILHSALTGSETHEPKGADTASAGEVYVADGTGSGAWQTHTIPYEDIVDLIQYEFRDTAALEANTKAYDVGDRVTTQDGFAYDCVASGGDVVDADGNEWVAVLTAATQSASEAEQSASEAEQSASEAEQSASEAEQSASEAEQSASEAEVAADAAFTNADVYADTATGRAAVADGDQFMVVVGREIVRYERTSAGTQDEKARYYTSSGVDDPARDIWGIYLVDPHYEKSSGYLYLRPSEYGSSGNYAYIRGGFLSNADFTYAKIKADLGAMATPAGGQIGVTSPMGVTDCIRIGSQVDIYYDPNTGDWGWGSRAKQSGKVVVVRNDVNDQIGACTEHPEIVLKLSQNAVFATASEHLLPVVAAVSKLPDFDTSALTLTVPYDTIAIQGGVPYQITTETVVDLTETGSSVKLVYMDKRDKSFHVQAWNSTLNAEKAGNYLLFAMARIVGGGARLVMTCAHTINGVYNGGEGNTESPRGFAPPAKVKGIAHRGYSSTHPENTLAAYTEAYRRGFSVVEMDVLFTSDGEPVLLHDDTIDRTSNGTGAINSITLATAKTYDFGSWKDVAFTGEKIPTLYEALRHCAKLGMHPYIELKGAITQAQADRVVDDVAISGMASSVTYMGFSTVSLDAILKASPNARVGFTGNINASMVSAAASRQFGRRDVFLNVNFSTATKPLVDAALREGLAVEAYTTNDAADVLALADWGVTGIITDSLDIQGIIDTDLGV